MLVTVVSVHAMDPTSNNKKEEGHEARKHLLALKLILVVHRITSWN
jgi:hypothetical protein